MPARESDDSSDRTLYEEFLRTIVKQGPLVLVLCALVYFTGTKIVFPIIEQSITTMRNQDEVLAAQTNVLTEVKIIVQAISECAKRQESQIGSFAAAAKSEVELLNEAKTTHEKQLMCLERIDKSLAKVPRGNEANN